MTTNSILSLFEGLSREQAKQLTDRIVPTLTAIRAEIVSNPSPNGNGNHKQGVQPMNDNDNTTWIDDLTAEEQEQIRKDLEASRARIASDRAAAAMQPRIAKYRADMLAARGKGHILTQIREAARKAGVPVDTIDFS